ncbi:Grip128, partial [Drosophila busckii]
STNSNQVRRDIDNLLERFRCEGMSAYADVLRQLSRTIMESPLCEEHYEVDVQYSMLDFLLSLTYMPTQNVRKHRLQMGERLLAIEEAHKTASDESGAENHVTPNSSETEINWEQYLSLDLPPSHQWSSSDDELSDWSSDTEGEEQNDKDLELHASTSLLAIDMDRIYKTTQSYQMQKNTYMPEEQTSTGKGKFKIIMPELLPLKAERRSAASWCKLPALPPLQPPDEFTYCKPLHIDAKKVEQLLLQEKPAKHWSNFGSDYVRFLNKKELGMCKYKLPATENESTLLREIIYMFFAPASCIFFELDERTECISVRPNVTIHSATAATVQRQLELHLLPALHAMMELRQFINEQLLYGAYERKTGSLGCFAASLRETIKPVKQQLMDFERQLLQQQQSVTLIGFIIHMEPHLQQLLLLQRIKQSVLINGHPNCVRSAYLLSQLYQQSLSSEPHQKLATALLLASLQRYCAITDAWWQRAELMDWHKEYIVEHYEHEAAVTGCLVRESLLACPPTAITAQLQRCELYQLLLQHALDAGETQDMLQGFHLLGSFLNSIEPHQQAPLHGELVRHICSEVQALTGRPAEQSSQLPSTASQLPTQLPQLANLELMHIFSRPRQAQMPPQVDGSLQLNKLLQALKSTPLQLPNFVCRALDKPLRERRLLGELYLMHWYREELQLAAHVQLLRHVMLLEADYLLYGFYTKIFRQIEKGIYWARSGSLTLELYELLQPSFGQLACKFYFKLLSRVRMESFKVFEAVEAVKLEFDISAPLRRVITATHIDKYNDIFRFMLKVKWSAWKLENMRFIRSSKSDPYAPLDLLGLTVRRLEMVRFWLINLIYNVHNHLCTYVLQSIGREFERQLPKCSNMHELCRLHDEFLRRLTTHCLLGPEFEDFSTTLEQLFHLVHVLDLEWTTCDNYLNESHALSPCLSTDEERSRSSEYLGSSVTRDMAMEYLALNQVVEIEQTYIRCHQMLAKLLRTLVFEKEHTFCKCAQHFVVCLFPT